MIRLGVLSLEHPHAVGNHFPSLVGLANRVRVAAIAEPNLGAARSWVKKFGAEYYRDCRAMLADSTIDAVLITSRNCDHARHTIECAEGDKDVLCDKPIATRHADAAGMVRACRGAGVEVSFPDYLIPEHGQLFLDYADHKEKGQPMVGADGVDGLRSLELVFAGYDSLRTGRTVRVKREEI